MKLCEAFASRLTELLAERNISLYKFCVNSGIGRSTLINLSKGDSKSPTLETVYQVFDALGITPQEFLSSELFNPDNIDLK